METPIRQITFTALIPQLYNEHGHVLPYNLAAEEAVALNGWKYNALVPKNCPLTLPPHWKRVLRPYQHTDSKGLFLRPKEGHFFSNLLPFLRKIHGDIVFIESFTKSDLTALAWAIAFSRPSYDLWILHRTSPKYGRFLFRLMEKRLQGKLVHLTDSDLLQQQWTRYLKRPVSVLPIPHTPKEEVFLPKENFFWWPGGDPTRYKGLKIIQRLVRWSKGLLYVSENARCHLPKGSMETAFLPAFLPEETYWSLMRRARFVLLPNDPRAYAASTSGIFTEAICAGAVPLVTRNTWMAHELKKFGLHSLISDFGPDFASITYSASDLEKMQSHWRRFHCIPHFAATLRQLRP